jgi:predicted HTH transcriptional regulator
MHLLYDYDISSFWKALQWPQQRREFDKMQTDKINSEMIRYMAKNGRTRAGELAELIGITVPSIRYRLFQLMACGILYCEKTRDHEVWFFVKEK